MGLRDRFGPSEIHASKDCTNIMPTFQLTLDDEASARLEEIKSGFHLESDRGALIVALGLAAELSHHIDYNGCIHLMDGTKIKVRDVLLT